MADEFSDIPANVTFMFETIADRIQACRKHADTISMGIFKNNDIEIPEEINYNSIVVSSKLGLFVIVFLIFCEGNVFSKI